MRDERKPIDEDVDKQVPSSHPDEDVIAKQRASASGEDTQEEVASGRHAEDLAGRRDEDDARRDE